MDKLKIKKKLNSIFGQKYPSEIIEKMTNCIDYAHIKNCVYCDDNIENNFNYMISKNKETGKTFLFVYHPECF